MVKAAQSQSQCHISVFYIVSIAIFGLQGIFFKVFGIIEKK
jgi:hypothetical protein